MKIYAVGLDPIWIAAIRDRGYAVVPCVSMPEPETVRENALFVTDRDLDLAGIDRLRETYPNAELIYAYTRRGVSGWHTAAALCAKHGVRFVRPGVGRDALLDLLDSWYGETDRPGNVIGVFGTLPGVGVTRIAATIAAQIAAQIAAKKVLLIGCNVYNPGWDGETVVSLDRWKQRLTSRMLRTEDFEQALKMNGFSYVPGNFDPLSALDFTEDEAAHLMEAASKAGDVVVADFGSIPESAFWYYGMQSAAIRIFVTQPELKRLAVMTKLAEKLGIGPGHLFLIANRVQPEDMTLKTLAEACGAQPFFSFPYKGNVRDFVLPLVKREQEQVQDAVGPFLAAMGIQEPVARKKGWF